MREIKFRAWNLKTKKMLPPSDVRNMPVMPGVRNPDDRVGTIYLQYTGLKDKNGVEIYEGDVVKSDNYKPLVIEWDDEAGGFISSLYVHQDNDSLEVIGNIYENPELLEKKEK